MQFHVVGDQVVCEGQVVAVLSGKNTTVHGAFRDFLSMDIGSTDLEDIPEIDEMLNRAESGAIDRVVTAIESELGNIELFGGMVPLVEVQAAIAKAKREA